MSSTLRTDLVASHAPTYVKDKVGEDGVARAHDADAFAELAAVQHAVCADVQATKDLRRLGVVDPEVDGCRERCESQTKDRGVYV